MRLCVWCACLLAASAVTLGPARAQTKVDLELILAVDASRSIDMFEYRLQRQGYAQALRDPAIVKAITTGEFRRIGLTYVEWGGALQQAVLVKWAVIDGQAAANKFAAAVLAAPRIIRGSTSISAALDYSVRHFEKSGMRGTRRVIDVSGDGPNNRGRDVIQARDDAIKAGITINGLAILNDRPSRPPWPEEAVDSHYRRAVIGGPGAFMIVVKGFPQFAQAIRHKLLREVSGVGGPRHIRLAPAGLR